MMITLDEGIRAFCHLCNLPFKTLEELQKHNKDELIKHQKINAASREQNGTTGTKKSD